jgi:MFS transporter, putative metabolite:H+ symporter
MKLFRDQASGSTSETAAPLLTDESSAGCQNESSEVLHTTLDEVLDGIPVAFFHMRLLALCGLAFMADSMEVSLLSFISICAGSEWDLGNAEIASITGAVFGGQILGSAVWGPVADRFGRRTSFFLAYFLITTAGAASAFAPNLVALIGMQANSIRSLSLKLPFYLSIRSYSGFRAVVGFGVAGATVPFDLLAEFLSAEKRGQYLIQIEYYWTVGSLFVAGLAWGILGSMGWRALTLITVLPVLVVSVACAFILPESPR